MKCPFCGDQNDRVLESRTIRDGEAVRRRRECLGCGRRYSTFEEIEELRVVVVKRDGRREEFDRGKILRGMRVACEKRPVAAETLEAVVDEIEKRVYDRGRPEIESGEIGEMVIEALRSIDPVAYVRFASVYRQFQDVGQFREIVDVMGGRGRRPGRKPRD